MKCDRFSALNELGVSKANIENEIKERKANRIEIEEK